MRAPSLSFLLIVPALWLAGCSAVPHVDRQAPPLSQAAADLKCARRKSLPAETRAAYYLDAAALADSQFTRSEGEPKARLIYNQASAELTDMLQEAEGGRLWNRPLKLTVDGQAYRLRFTPKVRKGLWAPDYFTDFKPADNVNCGHVRRRVKMEGFGGTLVGIRQARKAHPEQRALFEPKLGWVAPVTATLDFRNGGDAVLTLSDPAVRKTARVHGKAQPLAADFTAPVAFHPPANELWRGLMGLMQVEKYMNHSGLFMVQPYDPDRIPVVLVHGLISTPQMWTNVMNELESDPALRGRFQFWVFSYPTGMPPAYSALLLRQELEKVHQLRLAPHGLILVGHSMGGLVSRMQATTTDRVIWDANFGRKADRYYQRLPADHLIKRALIFKANPEVKKVVFVCVPHRGSELAMGSIGAIGQRLITLPTSMVKTLTHSIMDILRTADGKVVMPNSITGLSPKSRTLIGLNKLPIRAEYYSIIGDRGRGNSPNSTDGVVPYWSSHLEGAKNERIVSGPHGSHEHPETLEELKRILSQ